MFSRNLYQLDKLDDPTYQENYQLGLEGYRSMPKAGNLLTSKIGEDLHLPCIDIDAGEMYEVDYRSWLIKLPFKLMEIDHTASTTKQSVALRSRETQQAWISDFKDILKELGLCSSVVIDETYMYAIFDCPVWKHPSTTDKHFHLFIDFPLSTKDYTGLIERMVKVGLVEGGYLDALRGQKQTFVRTDRTRPSREKD